MKNIKSLLALVLSFAMLFCLCACSDSSDNSSTDSASKDVSVNSENSVDNTSDASDASVATSDADSEPSEDETSEAPAKFTVTVVDTNGNAVKGAYIQLCKDACVFFESDENGIVKFSDEITEGYKLSVLSCPDGYVYEGEAEVYLESGITEYTVTLSVVEG